VYVICLTYNPEREFNIWSSAIHRAESPVTNKKAKKSAIKNSVTQSFDSSDEAAKRARAERFQREHDLERQRRNGGGFYGSQASSLKTNHHNAHLFNAGTSSRSSSPSVFGGNPDDPEADPVCVFIKCCCFCLWALM